MPLSAFGAVGDLRPVSPAIRQIYANRVTYQRDELSEWYVNDQNGLEQGFTLTQAPSHATTNELALELTILGTLTPRLDANDVALELLSTGGVTVLQFG